MTIEKMILPHLAFTFLPWTWRIKQQGCTREKHVPQTKTEKWTSEGMTPFGLKERLVRPLAGQIPIANLTLNRIGLFAGEWQGK